METYTLVLMLWANTGGAGAIEHVPGIPTKQECEELARDFEDFGDRAFMGPRTVRARCVRSREVLQPLPQIERPK